MQTIPWFEVVSPKECFVVKIPSGKWVIFASVDGEGFAIDFGSGEIFPSQFESEKIAERALANLDRIFEYLRIHEEAQDLSNSQNALPCVSHRELPQGTKIKEHLFANGLWGIVALTSHGPCVVEFDAWEEECGFLSYSNSQEKIREVKDFLELILDPNLPSGDPGEDFQSQPPAFRENAAFLTSLVPSEEIEKDFDEIWYIEMGWLVTLRRGNRRNCTCRQCRTVYERRIKEIKHRYEEEYGFVPGEISVRISKVYSAWSRREESIQ